MLFSCLPPGCKCEHIILRRLIVDYNEQGGGVYERLRRPEMEERNRPEPELVLEGAEDGPEVIPVAIERKSVVWPVNSHLANHRNSHELLQHVQSRVCSEDETFINGLYQLRFGESSMQGLSNREIWRIGLEIADVVLAHPAAARSEQGIAGRAPIAWGFGPVPEWDRDETTPEVGFGMLVHDDLRHDAPSRAEALVGFGDELARHLVSVGEKFENYDQHRRLLALQFFGESSLDIDEEDLIDLIEQADLPDSVDEVWLAYHDWLNAYDHEVGWRPVWTRGE